MYQQSYGKSVRPKKLPSKNVSCGINLCNMLIIFNRYSGWIADLVLLIRHMSLYMWFWDMTIIHASSTLINC